MSFVTYRLTRRLRSVGKGATEARLGQVEAVVKQDHNEARGQVYSEIVACRLAGLLGLDVACGVHVAHDTGLKFSSLVISNVTSAARDIDSAKDVARITARYPRDCARIAVFDLWIGNDDRRGNVRANVSRSSDHLIVALDRARALLGGGEQPFCAYAEDSASAF